MRAREIKVVQQSPIAAMTKSHNVQQQQPQQHQPHHHSHQEQQYHHRYGESSPIPSCSNGTTNNCITNSNSNNSINSNSNNSNSINSHCNTNGSNSHLSRSKKVNGQVAKKLQAKQMQTHNNCNGDSSAALTTSNTLSRRKSAHNIQQNYNTQNNKQGLSAERGIVGKSNNNNNNSNLIKNKNMLGSSSSNSSIISINSTSSNIPHVNGTTDIARHNSNVKIQPPPSTHNRRHQQEEHVSPATIIPPSTTNRTMTPIKTESMSKRSQQVIANGARLSHKMENNLPTITATSMKSNSAKLCDNGSLISVANSTTSSATSLSNGQASKTASIKSPTNRSNRKNQNAVDSSKGTAKSPTTAKQQKATKQQQQPKIQNRERRDNATNLTTMETAASVAVTDASTETIGLEETPTAAIPKSTYANCSTMTVSATKTLAIAPENISTCTISSQRPSPRVLPSPSRTSPEIPTSADNTATTKPESVNDNKVGSPSKNVHSPGSGSYSLDFLHAVRLKMTAEGGMNHMGPPPPPSVPTFCTLASMRQPGGNFPQLGFPPGPPGHRQQRYAMNNGGIAYFHGPYDQHPHSHPHPHPHHHQQQQQQRGNNGNRHRNYQPHYHHQPKQLTIASFIQKELLETRFSGRNESDNLHNAAGAGSSNTATGNYDATYSGNRPEHQRYQNHYRQQQHHQAHYQQTNLYTMPMHPPSAYRTGPHPRTLPPIYTNQNIFGRHQHLQQQHTQSMKITIPPSTDNVMPETATSQSRSESSCSSTVSSSSSVCSSGSISSVTSQAAAAQNLNTQNSTSSLNREGKQHTHKHHRITTQELQARQPSFYRGYSSKQQRSNHHKHHSSNTPRTMPQHQNYSNLTYVHTTNNDNDHDNDNDNGSSDTNNSTATNNTQCSLSEETFKTDMDLDHGSGLSTPTVSGIITQPIDNECSSSSNNNSQPNFLPTPKRLTPSNVNVSLHMQSAISSPLSYQTANQSQISMSTGSPNIICCTHLDEATSNQDYVNLYTSAGVDGINNYIALTERDAINCSPRNIIAGNDYDSDTSSPHHYQRHQQQQHPHGVQLYYPHLQQQQQQHLQQNHNCYNQTLKSQSVSSSASSACSSSTPDSAVHTPAQTPTPTSSCHVPNSMEMVYNVYAPPPMISNSTNRLPMNMSVPPPPIGGQPTGMISLLSTMQNTYEDDFTGIQHRYQQQQPQQQLFQAAPQQYFFSTSNEHLGSLTISTAPGASKPTSYWAQLPQGGYCYSIAPPPSPVTSISVGTTVNMASISPMSSPRLDDTDKNTQTSDSELYGLSSMDCCKHSSAPQLSVGITASPQSGRAIIGNNGTCRRMRHHYPLLQQSHHRLLTQQMSPGLQTTVLSNIGVSGGSNSPLYTDVGNNNNSNGSSNNNNYKGSNTLYTSVSLPLFRPTAMNTLGLSQHSPSANDFFIHTPPDRFLARSHLVETKMPPETLLNNTKWDHLSQSIWLKFVGAQQTEETFKRKMRLWRYLYILIKSPSHLQNANSRYGLYLVGSTISGFGSNSSDVDMCLVARTNSALDPRVEAVCNLTILRESLAKTGEFELFNLIEAKVPILRFRDRNHQLEVDLNFNNCVGIRNTHLLYCYSQLDWRLRPMVLVTKLWAQYHNINNAKNMTISSYSLALMVIHFLQYGVRPPVLPCLHKVYPDKFPMMRSNDFGYIDLNEIMPPYESANEQPIGELFLNFLEYYTNFDYAENAISIRTGGVLAVNVCRQAKSPKNDTHQWKVLCIEEPFDLTNTARSVYDFDTFERVKYVFHRSWQLLKETLDLNTVFTPIIVSSSCASPPPFLVGPPLPPTMANNTLVPTLGGIFVNKYYNPPDYNSDESELANLSAKSTKGSPMSRTPLLITSPTMSMKTTAALTFADATRSSPRTFTTTAEALSTFNENENTIHKWPPITSNSTDLCNTNTPASTTTTVTTTIAVAAVTTVASTVSVKSSGSGGGGGDNSGPVMSTSSHNLSALIS